MDFSVAFTPFDGKWSLKLSLSPAEKLLQSCYHFSNISLDLQGRIFVAKMKWCRWPGKETVFFFI